MFPVSSNSFKNKYRIPSSRLQGWDYSRNGNYFVTMCAKDRDNVFGECVHGEMKLSDVGKTALECWRGITVHFPFVKLDEFIIMPNHVHGIIVIDNNVRANIVETHSVEGIKTQNLASLG